MKDNAGALQNKSQLASAEKQVVGMAVHYIEL